MQQAHFSVSPQPHFFVPTHTDSSDITQEIESLYTTFFAFGVVFL